MLRDLGESVVGGVEVLAVWLVSWWKGCWLLYLVIGVRMADVVAWKAEGTALVRRQNIFRSLALFGGRF